VKNPPAKHFPNQLAGRTATAHSVIRSRGRSPRAEGPLDEDRSSRNPFASAQAWWVTSLHSASRGDASTHDHMVAAQHDGNLVWSCRRTSHNATRITNGKLFPHIRVSPSARIDHGTRLFAALAPSSLSLWRTSVMQSCEQHTATPDRR
jgi:hypothetical protein